jgi:hypothetical protein
MDLGGLAPGDRVPNGLLAAARSSRFESVIDLRF